MKTGQSSEPSGEAGWILEVLLCEGTGTLLKVTSQLVAKLGLYRNARMEWGNSAIGLREGALSVVH